MRAILLRGLGAGLAFAAALLLVETIGIALFIRAVFLAGAVELLQGELPSLVLRYCLLGLALGLAVGVPVAALQRRWPAPWNRSGALVGCLVLAFGVLAFAYPAESMVTRGTYFAEALGAWILTGLGRLLLAGLGRLQRRLPPAWSTPRARKRQIAALAMAGFVAAVATGWLLRPATRPEVARPELAQGSLPNVVLIVVDTLRRDHVSAYGYARPTSPNIDRLAEQGVLYEKAFTPAPWTLPAHASLFTGLYPSQHQTNYEHTRLGADKLTLAEMLQARGYRTGGYSANPWVSDLSGLDQGFDEYECLGRGTVSHPFFVNLLEPRQDLGGEDVTDRLIDFMRRAKQRGRPFFAFANYLEVHEPFGTVPESLRTRFLSQPIPRDAGKAWLRDGPRFLCADCAEGSTRPGMRCEGQRWRVTDERVRDISALYDAGVLYVDQQIGKVRAALAELGVLDQTLLIVTSDHGEDIGEHGHMGHGVFLHEAMLSIPLVIRYPAKFPPNTRVPTPVSLLDVLPTIEQLTGISSAVNKPGTSLVPSPALAQREPVVHAEADPFAPSVVKTLTRLYDCDMSLTLDSRLSSQRDSLKYVWASSGEQELYDLGADPREERNLANARAEQSRQLRTELLKWLTTVRPARNAAQKGQLDAKTKRELESLGYVQ